MAEQAEKTRLAQSVDYYYLAAGFASFSFSQSPNDPIHPYAWKLYHTCAARMLEIAPKAGRFVRGRGIILCANGERTLLPLSMHGFVWQLKDFQQMYPVGCYRSAVQSRCHQQAGFGVPVVVQRTRNRFRGPSERFYFKQMTYPATAVLRPDRNHLLGCPTKGNSKAVIELYDTFRIKSITNANRALPLAWDFSAALAFRAQNDPNTLPSPLRFFQPGIAVQDEGLFFEEPYQKGKIPLVLIHGLYSSPTTWIDLIADLRATPGFTNNYQIWTFRYATAKPFLASAARLREELRMALATCDPHRKDPALRRMVLVGHSMGGLVAKLQVICSGDQLWNVVANKPLAQVRTTPQTKKYLREVFYVRSEPYVKRLVLIATPHGGSPIAGGLVSGIVDKLITPEPQAQQVYDQLRRDNPGLLSGEVSSGFPSSVDLLSSESCLLRAIRRIPVASNIPVHSIIGTGRTMLLGGPADGVVPVQSARYHYASTELRIPAVHTTIHQQPAATAEVVRILRSHLRRK
ncbi:MAG: esterase/lipase family protein [Gemmataceae bacterium]